MDDRRRHVYIIGKSGVGKSVLLENMALDDVKEGRGVIVVDPHGEFADKMLACIPDERMDDVVVFDPADRAYPIAFNLLEHVEDDFKGMVASGFVGIFKKIFGYSWGPRLEHILRNTVLALLDYTNSTMLDIPRMLTEAGFRERVVEKVKDPVIKEFWINEFGSYDNKFRTEAVSPILNKIGQFLATATIRNIVGQPQSTLDIRNIMDNKQIMIVNLSRGKIGEDNSALLGAMIITKIQLAAMSRADITVDHRPDCYLYIDEFQNFATESFAVILSEARKYHLNLNIANQYITQMPEEVRDAVFGNAGTIISFRVGGTDADFLVKEYEPVFEQTDLVNLDKYHIYIKLLIDGISSPAFSAQTLPPIDVLTGNIEKVIELSRKKYAKTRAEVEQKIEDRTQAEIDMLKKETESFKKGGLEAILVKNKKGNKDNATNDHRRDSEKKDITRKKVDHKQTTKEQKQENESEKTIEKPKRTNSRDDSNKKEQKIDAQADDQSDDVEERERSPRYLKHQNIIGDKIYKEHTARGGIKWYVGEKIVPEELDDLGVTITDDAKMMMKLAKKVFPGSSRDSVNGDEKKKNKDRKDSKAEGGAERNSKKNMTAQIKPQLEKTSKDESQTSSQGKQNKEESKKDISGNDRKDEDKPNGMDEGKAIKL